MAYGVSVGMTMKGLPELIARLRNFDRKLCRKAMKKGIGDANRAILRTAKGLVPEETKSLKKALGSKVKSYKVGAVVVGMVGPRKDARGKPAKFRKQVTVKTSRGSKQVIRNPVKYAHLVEKGTRSHTLGKGSVLRRKNRTVGKQIQRGIRHPGATADPFLGPSLDQNRTVAVMVLARSIQEALAKAGK